MKTREEVQNELIRKANEQRAKSMQDDSRLIMMLAEAAKLILTVANELQDRHKYDLYPITEAREEHYNKPL
ncbi:MAG: hypothetical protein J6Y48_10740 [Clostridia bacterium]|nr:hypothetical protein [Clostridia bacterium]